MDTASIASRFKLFGATECKGSSTLYEHLSEKIAHDDELLQLASHARQGQPIPNLFLGAVHYLLQDGKDHELREYYGSVVSSPRHVATVFPFFRDFCLTYKQEIISILENKLVQTNEVRRCSYLYPAFCYVYEKTNRPLAFIEIGTSAGLQLLWDQYGYAYSSDNEVYGEARSELIIRSEPRGGVPPCIRKQSPPVAARIGVDLHINDLGNRDDYLWLRSLIWPEHTERVATFEGASRCLQKQSIQLIEGDGITLLPEIARGLPRDSVTVVFHTHVANQIPTADKHELTERIAALGEGRDIFHLYNNMWDAGRLHLDYYLAGNAYHEILAETDGHGRWFQWKP